MKKKSESRVGRVFKRIFNVRVWFDWSRVRMYTLYLVYGTKKFIVPQKPTNTETFEEAKKKFHLTARDLKERQNALFRLSIVMLVFALGVLGYSGYHFFYGSYKAAIVSLVITLVALTFAFRYHFWYFQIKEHKLGCSIKEWFWHGLMGEKNE